MISKLLVVIAVTLVSVSCAGQATPAVFNHPPLSTALGAGMNYWSGDWGHADINRWGPQVWGTLTIWHDLSLIAEGHSMIVGGNAHADNYKYFTGGGGLIYTSGYWGRFQPYFKGESGFGSLTHPSNGTLKLHHTSYIWTTGAGVEYHLSGSLWANVGYTYDFFPDFHSSVTNQYHTLNPRGLTFGGTYRFGPNGSKF